MKFTPGYAKIPSHLPEFDHRLSQVFFQHVILSKSSRLGKVTCYFQRTEFQLKGEPRPHIALWVENAPQLDTATEDEITSFIEKYLTCALPPKDHPLYGHVNEKQRHSHSVTCKKHGNNCRFLYPKLPSEKTILSSSAVATDITQKKSKIILSTVLDYLTTGDDLNNLSVKDILQNCSLPSDTYHKALAVSKSRTVVLKRIPTERNINNYNPDIIKYWEANMDLQYVCM